MSTTFPQPQTGKKIREVRNSKNVTLQMLEEITGIDAGTLSRIENGTSSKDKNFELICAALSIDFRVFSEEVAFSSGKISPALREQIVTKRRDLKLSLTDLQNQSPKNGKNKPRLSVSTLSAIEKGKIVSCKPETLGALLELLGITHLQGKHITIGIDQEADGELEYFISEFQPTVELMSLSIIESTSVQLLFKLRQKTVNFAFLNIDTISGRRNEFMPVAMITKSLCICALCEEKENIRHIPGFRTLFLELFALVNSISKEKGNQTYSLLFCPEYVL